MPVEPRYLRARVPRNEDARLLTGRALFVEDVQLVRQTCTWVHVEFDDESVANFFDDQVDSGRTHPESAHLPAPGRSEGRLTVHLGAHRGAAGNQYACE